MAKMPVLLNLELYSNSKGKILELLTGPCVNRFVVCTAIVPKYGINNLISSHTFHLMEHILIIYKILDYV